MDKIFELPTVGEILTQEFLEPLNITPYRLAKDLGVSTSTILDLFTEKETLLWKCLCDFQNILAQHQNFGLICKTSLICEPHSKK